MIKFTPYVGGEQPINKQFLQMERNIMDRDVIGCVLDNSCVWAENGYCQIFWGEDDIKKQYEDGKKLLIESKRKETLEKQKNEIKLYWNEAKQLLTAVKNNADIKELAVLYDKYSHALRRIYAHFITSTAFPFFAVENKLKELISNINKDKLEEYFAALTTSHEDDMITLEKKAWLNIMNNPTKQEILKHYNNYSVVLANIFSEEDVLKLAEKRKIEHSFEEIEKELEESQKQKDLLMKRKEKILNESNSDEIRQLSEFLCESGLLRLELKHCWNGEPFHLLPFFQRIANLENVTVRDIYMFYTRKEVSGLLNGKSSLDKETLEKRKKHCLLHYHNPQIDIYNGIEAIEAKKGILDPSLPKKELRSFKGSIANKGRVIGKARVVRVDNPHQIREIASTLQKDHILVTGMTNPTMIPLIGKVSGILTDEGGIACHAAIISREFNLPCIVGSSIATHVLEDGDYIELDANTGMVNKLTEEEYNN